MEDLKTIVDLLVWCFNLRFNIFGISLSFFSILIGLALISMVIYAIQKLFF